MSATYFAHLGEYVRTCMISLFCLQLFTFVSTNSMHWIFALDICLYSDYLYSLIFGMFSYLHNKANASLGLGSHLFLVGCLPSINLFFRWCLKIWISVKIITLWTVFLSLMLFQHLIALHIQLTDNSVFLLWSMHGGESLPWYFQEKSGFLCSKLGIRRNSELLLLS